MTTNAVTQPRITTHCAIKPQSIRASNPRKIIVSTVADAAQNGRERSRACLAAHREGLAA
jgi:hypothetical protein